MPRISEVEDAGGDPALDGMFKAERARFGDLLHPTKVMAHCPPLLQAAKEMGAALARSGRLPSGLAELVSLRVATINGCPF
jgi:alkylhydroperoxidase family enzyme